MLRVVREALVRFNVPPLTVKLPTTTLPETVGVPLEMTTTSLLPGTTPEVQLVGLDHWLETAPDQVFVLAGTDPAEIASVRSVK